MRVKYLLESGIFERRDIRSGRIYRQGSQPEYGVIFTANASKSEDDLGLNPELVLGTFLGSRIFQESEQDRFFEILGGYFYHDNYPAPGVTTHVFGIALDPLFGITEGGTTTLNDKWKLDDPQKPILDESYWSKDSGKHHGWTFIVTLKERETYPHSDEELKIFVYCPEIKDIKVTYGGCITDGKVRRRRVTFSVAVEGTAPANWSWNFGDGSSQSGAGMPAATMEHRYEQKPEKAPTLRLIGRLPCDEISKQADMSGFEECLPCPKIADVQYQSIARDEKFETIEFFAEMSRPPDMFEWDFGDGSAKEQTTATKIIHAYAIPNRDTIYKAKVTSHGPEDCRHVLSKRIIIKSAARAATLWFWLHLLVAFLSATTFGVFLVFVVDRLVTAAQYSNWLASWLIVLAFLTGIAILIWYYLGSKSDQTPGRCEWLAIGWIAMLAGLLDALYLKSGCGAWWWLVILILLGLSGFLFYTWVKKCIVNAREFIYYFIACFLAVIVVCGFIAARIIASCLQQ